jgi:hypothetical protein
MSNKAQDHVHRLIHSMSRAEKRYFKLHALRHAQSGQSNHQVLFDAIAAMEVYDERALLERFSTEAFTHRFPVTKRRLYEHVLRSLDAFHAEASLDIRIHRGLHQVKILYDRALYDDAVKLLSGLRRLARQHDRQPALHAVLEWERRLAERDNYAHVGEEQLDELVRRSESLRDEQEQLVTLWELKSRLFITLYRTGKARDASMRRTVDALLARDPLQDPTMALSTKARFLHHHLHGAAAFAKGDLQHCLEHLEANIELLEGERERCTVEPHLAISVLSNAAFVCISLGRDKEAIRHLKAFRNAPAVWNMPETPDLDLKLFSTSYSLELGMHTRSGNIDQALGIIPLVERGIDRHGHNLGPLRRAGFRYQIAVVHFMAGNWQDALRWTNRLLDELRVEDSLELSLEGRLLYLAVLYETGKKDLLSYALRNTERFIKAHGCAHRFEPPFMTLMRALGKASTVGESSKAFGRFRDVLVAMSDDPLEASAPGRFDALAWAEGKLTGRSFAEVVRERASRPGRAA